MPTALRRTGIDIIGDMPWGTHFCHFFETQQDLIDTLIPYFKAGLEDKEYCLWLISAPLTVHAAAHALGQAVHEIDRYRTEQSIELIPHVEWFLETDTFDVDRVINGIQEKLDHALARGYPGMRFSGNPSWLRDMDHKVFWEYERALDELTANRPMLVSCIYPLATSGAADVFEIAETHLFAGAMRNGKWEVVETPELKQTKAKLARMNKELERRVDERTRELAATVEELLKEMSKRKLAEETLRLHARELEETNSALKVLLRQREGDRRAIEEKVHANVMQLVLPFIELLKKSKQRVPEDSTYLTIIESNLKEILSSFTISLAHQLGKLSSKEILIANLVKGGKQDKDIAAALNLSIDTIKAHRRNIRKKLGLRGDKTNLRSYLSNINDANNNNS